MTAPDDNGPPHALNVSLWQQSVVTTAPENTPARREPLRAARRREDQGQQSESRCTGRSIRCFTWPGSPGCAPTCTRVSSHWRPKRCSVA